MSEAPQQLPWNAQQFMRVSLIACRDATWTVIHEGSKNPHRFDIENAAALLTLAPTCHVRLFSIDYPLEERHFASLLDAVKGFHVDELRFGHHSDISRVRAPALHQFIRSFLRVQRVAFYPQLCRDQLTDAFLQLCAEKDVTTLALPDAPPADGVFYDFTEDGVLKYCFGLPQSESRWLRVEYFQVKAGFFGKLVQAHLNSESTADIALRIASSTAIVPMDELNAYASNRRRGPCSTRLYFEFTGELRLQVAMTLCRTIMWVQRAKKPTVFQTSGLPQSTPIEVNRVINDAHGPVHKRISRSALPSETWLHVYANLSRFDLDAVAISNRHQWANICRNSKYVPLRRIKLLKLATTTVVTGITAANERRAFTMGFDHTNPAAALHTVLSAARLCYVHEFILALPCFPTFVDKLAKGLRTTHVGELRITSVSAVHCIPAKSFHRFILSFPSVKAVCSTALHLRASHMGGAFLQKCSAKGITTLELECRRFIARNPPTDDNRVFALSDKSLLDFAFGGRGKSKRVFRMKHLRLPTPAFFEELVQAHNESDYEGDIIMVLSAVNPLFDLPTLEKYEALGNVKEGENNFTVFDFVREGHRLQIATPQSGKVLLVNRTAKTNGHPFFF